MNEVELTVDIIIEKVSHVQEKSFNVYYYLHTIAGKNLPVWKANIFII